MKLLHFSDTHLGFSEYTKIDSATGLNQREQDFYSAWDQVIDSILSIRPDVVIHAGDLFHTPRPSNRAIRVALESIQKVGEAGIPFVIISGNHETPRIRTTGSIFESITLFENVYAAYSSHYERFRVKDIDFHCIPHCSLSEELDEALHAIEIDPAAEKNVLITHGAWSGKTFYGMGEFNEQRLPDVEGMLGTTFDYIALGHYHRRVDIKDHICYSGSTERTSLNEHNTQCGFLTVDLQNMHKEFQEISTRAMIKLPEISCKDLTAVQIYDKLNELAGVGTENAIVQLTLRDINDHTFVKLDMRAIDEIFASAFHLEKQLFRREHGTDAASGDSRIESLPVEFERYIETITNKELDKERLAKLGVDYLSQFE